MKRFLLFIALAQVTIGFGQTTTKRPDEWDSLFNRNRIEILRYKNILAKELRSTDTTKTLSTISITYFSKDSVKLEKIENMLDSNSRIRGILHTYYNELGLAAYIIGYKKCCPDEIRDNETCFERVTDYERFEYENNTRRILVHVFHVTTPGTYKETFSYDADGTKHVNRFKISETKFWQ